MSLSDFPGWDRRDVFVSVPIPGDVPSGLANEQVVAVSVSVPIPGDVPFGLYNKDYCSQCHCFRPHTWGCPFRTKRRSLNEKFVSVPIPGDVPFGQNYKCISPFYKGFRPHTWGCPFRTYNIRGIMNAWNSFRPHTWGCPFRTMSCVCGLALRFVSVPIPGDVPFGLYPFYHTEKYINCKQKIQNPLPVQVDFHRFWGRF